MSRFCGTFFLNMDNSKKEIIIREILGYFLKYGVKDFTMDDIAEKLGVSKKTLYQIFKNKENLVFEIVDELWLNFLEDVEKIKKEDQNAIFKIIKIYTLAVHTIKTINPVFIRSLQKYQSKVMIRYEEHRKLFREKVIQTLLIQAKEENLIDKNINIDFFIQVNFENVDYRIWYDKIINQHSVNEIVNYLIVYRLKGIITNPNLL